MTDDFTIDEFLDSYEEPVVEAKVCMKANLVAEHARLDGELQEARLAAADVMHDPEVSRLRQAVEELEGRIAASQRTFAFRSIGHLEWQNLKRKHPPTKEQRAEGLDINVETFVVPAIAACAAKPEMTLAQANELARRLPEGEIQKLFRAVMQANSETLLPKSMLAAAIGRLDQSDRSSTTAALAEFLGQRSSDANGDRSPSTATTTPDA